MRSPAIFVSAALFTLNATAHALSPYREVTPERINELHVAFDIQSKQIANGDVAFTVNVSEKDGPKIPDHYNIRLAIIKITDFPGGRFEGGTVVRELKSEHQGKSVFCAFTVSKKELEDPNISFLIEWPRGKFNVDSYFAPLRNFLPK
jgi:hypothetical protein